MDLLNVAGEESLDLPDITFGFNSVPIGLLNELTGAFLLGQGDGCIVSGFVPAAASPTGPVTIGQDGVRNVAFLGHQTGQGVTYGVLTATGNASQALDISTYAAGTYVIWVRFNRLPAEPQTRTFWSGIDQSEYAKTTNTRLTATWEVRIEVAQPAPEWLAIGQAVVASQGSGQGNTVQVSDQRPLYFEGSSATAYTPNWGTDADRGNRQTAAIGSLRTMLDAIKQCLVDVKGPGLQPWFSRYIGGMNIGTRFDLPLAPVAERLAVGDAGFFLQGNGFAPYMSFDGGDSRIEFSRTSKSIYATLETERTLWLQRGKAALGRSIPNLISLQQPLLVWENAPFGRVAQFAHTGSEQASISIGTVDNAGGRIDFAAASIDNFRSVGWSLSCRNTTPNDFSIIGSQGIPFTALMGNSTGDFTTTLRGRIVNIVSGTADNEYVRITRPALGPSLYAYNEGGTAFLTLYYRASASRFWSTGNSGNTFVQRISDGFHVTFSAALPANPLIFVSCPALNQDVTAYYNIVDSTTIKVALRLSSGGAPNADFSLAIFYGGTGAGKASSG